MNPRMLAGLLGSVLFAGRAFAQTTQAVEWKVSDGGNGHWYQLQIPGPISWTDARLAAERSGGHLATVASASENALLIQLGSRSVNPSAWINDAFGNSGGPLLGGYQPSNANSAQPWAWVTGEPWNWTGWAPGEPNGGFAPGNGYIGQLGWNGSNSYRGWFDAGLSDYPAYPRCVSYLIEWDADCNGDGVIDYGQIRRGELDDDNTDGTPDVCQVTVTGVIPVSGPASGGTTITLKGTNFPANPTVLVGGFPASNIVRISATRITATTPVGLPGMSSVAVDNWVQPNAFYYRPECGSDLDQNGVVDGGDMAILLLDWGPCSSSAAANAPEASVPYLLREDPTPANPQTH